MKKNILITGSTDGIGKLAAIKLAKAGHELCLHGRNAEKLNTVIEEIKSESKKDTIKGFVADFSDLAAVRAMANEINHDIEHIDVLINNAGIFKTKTPVNDEGMDLRILVNYLAPFVLTNEILPLIKRSADPLIINLSSAAQSSVKDKALSGQVKLSDQDAYAQSKLAILMWSFHMSKEQPDLSVIALNPGSLLNTNMVREAYGKFWSSADKGADIIYDLAVSNNAKANSGKYYDNDKGGFGTAHPDAYDDALIQHLIDQTKTLL